MSTVLVRFHLGARLALCLAVLWAGAACGLAPSRTPPDPAATTAPSATVTADQPTSAATHPLPALTPLAITAAWTETPDPVTPTPAPTPACPETQGQMSSVIISTRDDNYALVYNIYLPPCYQRDLDRRYPVLYLIHGQTYAADQWDRLGINEAADALITAGEAPPFIMVFPTDDDWRQPDEDPFGEVLVETLIPLIDTSFRTLPERDYRAIGGLSRGSGWAVHIGLTHPELFTKIGAHSLALFWMDAALIPQWIDAIPPEERPFIYLDTGRNDRELQNAVEFEALLNDRSMPHEWHLFDGFHDETYWSAHVEDYLRFYTEGWEANR